MKSRTENSIRNVSFSLFNQAVSLFLGFASRMVFIRVFGIEYLGLNGLFADVLTLLSMADLGIGTAMVYSFYKPLAENDHRKVAAYTTFFGRVYCCIAGFVAIIGVLLIPALPKIINLEKEIPHLEIYYLLALTDVVSSYLFIYRSSILSANQENYIVSKISIIINIGRTVFQIISAMLIGNYIVYLAVGLLFTIGNNLAVSIVATKKHPYIQEHVSLGREEKRGIYINIFSVLLYKVSSVLLNATDNLLISIIVGTAMVGYYSNYLLIQNKITQFYTLAFSAITASIGNLVVKEKGARRFEIFEEAQSISFAVCGILIPCYTVLVREFIGIWLGTEFLLPVSMSLVIGLNMYLTCVLQPLWSYREATGLYRKTKWVMLCCAGLNLVLSYVLGRLMGITGVILASALSRLLTYIWYEPRLLFREYFGRKEYKYYAQLIQNFVLVAVITTISMYIEGFFRVNSLGMWLIEACVIALVSCAVTLIFYRRSAGLRRMIGTVKSIINKRKRIQ